MNKKYTVKLTDDERIKTHAILNAPKTSTTIRKRASILLLADEISGKPPRQEEIARRCGVSDVTVYHTVKDYATEGADFALKFKSRSESNNPVKIKGEEEARLIALACSEPPAGFAKWTVRLLAKRAVELEIVESVCPETIRKSLKKHNLNRI